MELHLNLLGVVDRCQVSDQDLLLPRSKLGTLVDYLIDHIYPLVGSANHAGKIRGMTFLFLLFSWLARNHLERPNL